MKLSKSSGHTLVEFIMATVLVGMIFVIAGTLYATCLRLLNFEVNEGAIDADRLIGFERVTRDISLAEEAQFNVLNTAQIGLRIDPNPLAPATATAANDRWISYGFIGGRLRTRNDPAWDVVNGIPLAANNVAPGDAEVTPGLVIDPASRFNVVNPTAQGDATVVDIQMIVVGNAGQPNRTLSTRVALRRSK